MTLLFVDSFDHYATADIPKKWVSAGDCTIQAGAGRNSSQSLRMPSFKANPAVLALPLTGTYIIGFAFVASALSGSNIDLLQLRDANNPQVHISLTSSGLFSAYGGAGTGSLLGTSSAGISAGVYAYLEFKIVVHNTAGAVEIRVNGETVLSLTGVNTRYAASTNNYADALQLGYGTGANNTSDIDDFYLCDPSGTANNDFLGDVRIECLYPSGAGSNTNWTPSTGANYAAVDEALANTTDYVTSAADDQVDTYAFGNLAETSGSVKAVQLVAHAQKTDTGAKHLALVDRTNSTDHASADQPLSTSWKFTRQILETDAGNGGVAWTVANVNAAEFGVKSRA
jgi:hypothetical protein